MSVLRRVLKFGRRVVLGQAEGERDGSRLRAIADVLPNILTRNAKAITGGGAAVSVTWVADNFGWDISSWEIWISFAIAVAATVWRVPNRTTP